MINFFYFLSFLGILSALLVVFSKNPVHSVLWLIVTFFAIAGHYILLNAQFLAVVHIIVYAGAIMVLFLFVIMFLNLNVDTEPKVPLAAKISGIIAGGTLMITLLAILKDADSYMNANPDLQIGLIKTLGKVLYTDYLLPFEISSLLFLAAMIGAVVLAKKEEHE